MEFLNPGNLWFLIIIPIAWIFVLHAYEKRKSNLKILNLQIPPKDTLIVKLIINSLFLCLLVLAMARPYSGFDEVKKERIGADNLIILDISQSMRAKDTPPSRLDVAKRKVWDLANILIKKSTGDRIGLILFAGQAYLYCPPTVDFAALKQFLSHTKPELITAQGSGINLALTTALDVIKRTKMKSPRLFIFTDGEDRGFSETEALTTLTNGNLFPRILGIGTSDGATIEIPGQGYVKESSGKIVISKLKRETLSKLAEEAGGIYTNSTIGDSDLKLLLALKDSSEGLTNERGTSSVRIYNEFGHVLIWIAFGLLALGAFNKKFLPLTVLLVLIFSERAEAKPNTYEAWKAYKNEQYEDAKAGFESALATSPASPELLQSLGSSYYKLNQLADAERLFLELIDKAQSKDQKFNGYFNLGNSRLKQENLEGAISSYEEALRLKPDDEAAKFNLEYAKKLRKQKQQDKNQPQKNQNQEQPESDKKDSPQDKKDDSSSDDAQQPDDPKSKQEERQPGSDSKDSKDSESKDEQQPSDSQSSDKLDQELAGMPKDENQLTKKELAEKEARRWLDSLPDSPIQIRKDNRRVRSQNGQTW